MKKRVKPSSRSMCSTEYRWIRNPTTVITSTQTMLTASRWRPIAGAKPPTSNQVQSTWR